jgi:hypothetical protein
VKEKLHMGSESQMDVGVEPWARENVRIPLEEHRSVSNEVGEEGQ